MNFHCLMFSGIPFDKNIIDLLIDTARYMYQESKESFDFKTSAVEGKIVTQNKQYFLSSSVSGVKFEANIECEKGKTKVSFLVPKGFLESDLPSQWTGNWEEVFPNHPSSNAHLN